MTGVLIGLLLATLGIGWYAFERQSQVYQALIGAIAQQRDQAQHEAKVFRRIVLPVYDKAESSLESAAAKPETSSQPMAAAAPIHTPARVDPQAKGAAAPNPLTNRRTPFRIRFKQGARLLNTKQKATDTLAAALSSQKTQEAKRAVEASLNA
jgi:hypothetical protein